MKTIDINDLFIGVYNSIEPYELQLKINKFNSLCRKIVSRNEMKKALEEIINPIIFEQTIESPYLCRVRKHKNGEQKFTKYNDFWAPPREVCKKGRFNIDTESMFYVSTDLATPFYESKLLKGDRATLMMYSHKSKRKIKAVILDSDPLKGSHLKSNLTKNGILAYEMLWNFVKNEVSRDVGIGTEYLYDISNIIKNLYDKERKREGFIYSSITNFARKNCAIKPGIAQQLLKCETAVYVEFISYSDNNEEVILKPIAWTQTNNGYIADNNITYKPQTNAKYLTIDIHRLKFSNLLH